jgi:serine phosphatase RsbU (regulator of sigma subunit)
MNDGPSSVSTSTLDDADAPAAGSVDGPMWSWPDRQRWGVPLLFVVAAAAYSAGSELALLLIERSGLSSVFFIPAGITVAFLLRLPRRRWWVVVAAAGLAEMTMDLLDGYSVGATMGFAAANMVEPVIGALIVTSQCRALDLARTRHVWWFFVGAVVVGPAVGAATGSLPAHLLGEAEFASMFGQWWLGDSLGVLLVGGMLLVWQSSPDRRPLASPWGLGLIAGTLLVTSAVLAVDDVPLMFLVLIGVVVAGALFGVRAVAVTAFLVASTIAVDLTLGTEQLIAGLSEPLALIVIKLQLAVFTLAGLVVAAEAQERERATTRSAEARALVALSEQERRLERHIAVRLQEALLPDKPSQHERVEAAARYEAGGATMLVGGDWYDVFPLPDDRIGLTVGDVVGHGLEASAAMGRLRTAVAVLAMLTDSPGELLSHLDTYVREANGADFATAGYAILDPATGVLTFASAGHMPMLVVSASGATRWLGGGLSPPLYGGEVGPRPEESVTLEPGCLLIAYSDGLVERRGESLNVGLRRLEETVRALAHLSTSEICDRVIEEMGVAASREDDVVIVALRFLPAAGEAAGSPAPPDRERASTRPGAPIGPAG